MTSWRGSRPSPWRRPGPTTYLLPRRPDVNAVTEAWGKQTGQKGGQNSWVIDTLDESDVMVVDIKGRVIDATFVGDNLANSVWAKTGTGIVIDRGARDLEGVLEIQLDRRTTPSVARRDPKNPDTPGGRVPEPERPARSAIRAPGSRL
jgi:hypothetical protein